ncbi:transmembrane amino acid transporter protein-domain-containing protein [Naematelia encephala]|uniref:Transmembrane amino acid transporter protein-domain-containing protein n=1 Tax=Naematelia encephala TaxID=71784 RepID=A0A1Y2AY39_9TREE|nr:transmembrane amino acid transporter protein-domain-containing protein [Naematelia encephala]
MAETTGTSVPIPAGPQQAVARKRSKMMQSSLDLVFSYSRSQQLLYGKHLRSTPSFVDSSSSGDGYGSFRRRRRDMEDSVPQSTDEDAEEQYEDEEDDQRGGNRPEGGTEAEDDDDDDDDERPGESAEQAGVSSSIRRQSSGSPIIFQSDYQAETRPPPRMDIPPTATAMANLPPSSSRPGLLTMFSPVSVASKLGTSMTSSSGSTTPLARKYTLRETKGDLGSPTYSAPKALDPVLGEDEDVSPTRVDEATPLMSSTPATRTRRTSSIRRRRRSSMKSGIVRTEDIIVGESTDGQTLFNAIAVLIGIGLLSMPLAFAYAGWIAGTGMLVGFAWLTCHTAKLLARLVRSDASIMGYTDIGRRAFGGLGSIGISGLFCLELFALSVALIVLFGDSLEAIHPQISSNMYKIIGFFIILPTALMPLRLLSLPSLLSSVSSLLLVIVILVDGFLKSSPPGSIRHPASTSLGPEWTGANWLGGIGLILAGFGGHACMPNLVKDMRNPEHFDGIIDIAFVTATAISFVAGAAGYLMIGNTVSDEITRDLMLERYGYPRWLNLLALWMIVVNPVTKFGLASRPLNVTIESILSIAPSIRHVRRPASSGMTEQSEEVILDSSLPSPTASRVRPRASSSISKFSGAFSAGVEPAFPHLAINSAREEKSKAAFRVLSRTVVTALCTLAAIALPGFGRVMAFLGSFSAFLICIILPLSFYLRLENDMISDRDRLGPGWRTLHWGLLVMSVGLMVAGTTWAFVPGSGHGDLDL